MNLESLIDLTIKASAKMNVNDNEIEVAAGKVLFRFAKTAIYSVVNIVTREISGVLYCNLCGRGPFTKKGMFLHLSRSHRGEIRSIFEKELEKAVRMR